jgi:hypothetical protein
MHMNNVNDKRRDQSGDPVALRRPVHSVLLAKRCCVSTARTQVDNPRDADPTRRGVQAIRQVW